MFVSVQDSLVGVKAYLKSKGYQIVNESDKLSSDIYIYSQSQTDFYTFESGILPSNEGSLIINADNLSFHEIENIIRNRTYTPLFY